MGRWSESLENYREYMREREMSENTVEKYLRDAGKFLEFVGEREISRDQVLEYKEYLMGTWKISSVNSIPVITAEDRTLTAGDKFDPKGGVTAWDEEDGGQVLFFRVELRKLKIKKRGPFVIPVICHLEEIKSGVKNKIRIVRDADDYYR